MKNMTVDFSKMCGRIKPMHAVNNGPIYKFNAEMRITNMPAWIEAGIPFARTHDSSYCPTYGGPHTVDLNLIFTNFDADPYDAASYDFACTDQYLKIIEYSGTKVFYRLGTSIEHYIKKYHTLPPKDFKKWAVICEHIIRHYTEGWADGFHYDVPYWEIWNEPNLDPDDSEDKRCWGGTQAQFFNLFETASKHLKQCFPHLKIGGPACAGDDPAATIQWVDAFLREMQKRNVELDFFSWHLYANHPQKVVSLGETFKELLIKYGYDKTESICNEWNYLRGWYDEDFVYSLRSVKSIKGASYTLAMMCAGQASSLDMLMYYDARPCTFNGMFHTDLVCDVLKGYYPFKMFNELYKLENHAEVVSDSNLFACAAAGDTRAAFVFTHFCDDDATAAEDVAISLQGFGGGSGVKAACYLLDAEKDLELVQETVLRGDACELVLHAELFSSYLVILEKV